MSGRFNLADYVPVQERINLFWKDHPEGRIITTLESDPADFTTCRYRAELYIDADQQRPSATGWAFEVAGSGMANKTSHEENCETSAIGRALANMGYATSQKDRPSREEMHKASSDAPQARQAQHGGKYAQAAANAQTGAPEAPQASTGNVSEKQQKFIRALIHELEWTREDVERFLKMTYGVERISDLPTRQDVSAFIDHLQELKAQQEPAPVGADA
jgi:hypothetical protein